MLRSLSLSKGEGCVLLAVAVGTGMYYRRVIRGKHETMYRLIRELEHWKKEWGILMRHLELLQLYGDDNVETGHAPSLLKAWTQNGVLHVSGLTTGESWSIYNLYEQLIYTGLADGNEA